MVTIAAIAVSVYFTLKIVFLAVRLRSTFQKTNHQVEWEKFCDEHSATHEELTKVAIPEEIQISSPVTDFNGIEMQAVWDTTLDDLILKFDQPTDCVWLEAEQAQEFARRISGWHHILEDQQNES